MSKGDVRAARSLYLEAAVLEKEAYANTGDDKPRTRGIVAVSTVALYLKAGSFELGLREAWRLLASEAPLPEFAQAELESLIDDLRLGRDEARLGLVAASEAYDCILEGPRVRRGLAPVETVVQKIEQIARYGVRVYEYASQLPLRRGPVEAEMRARFGMLVSEPSAGSFRFQMRFMQAEDQMAMFADGAPASRGDVTRLFGEILEATVEPKPDDLDRVVSDQSYRLVFLKLVRNLAPSGGDLDRISSGQRGRSGPVLC